MNLTDKNPCNGCHYDKYPCKAYCVIWMDYLDKCFEKLKEYERGKT